MSILSSHFDNLMLSVFTDEELKQLPPLELNERKMMFIAGAGVVMKVIEDMDNYNDLEACLMDIGSEVNEFVNQQLKRE